LFEEACITDCVQHNYGDIRDLENLDKIFKRFNPEIVLHLAAQSLVRKSYKEPIETYSTNIMGTLNVLEAIRNSGSVQVAIIITSDKCYENREWIWGYRENEPMGGHDIYSSSKGCVELLVSSYRPTYFPIDEINEHGKRLASARAGNVIGGGDWAADRLIPDIIRAFQNNQIVNIRNPDAIRPWQHILDPLNGYLILAEKLWEENDGQFAEGWNFGPEDSDEKSVGWIVEQMVNRWGGGASWTIDSGEHPHEANYLKLNCSKAHNQLNWWPKWPLNTALDKTIDWYIAQRDDDDLQSVTLKQIAAFENI